MWRVRSPLNDPLTQCPGEFQPGENPGEKNPQICRPGEKKPHNCRPGENAKFLLTPVEVKKIGFTPVSFMLNPGGNFKFRLTPGKTWKNMVHPGETWKMFSTFSTFFQMFEILTDKTQGADFFSTIKYCRNLHFRGVRGWPTFIPGLGDILPSLSFLRFLWKLK